MTSTGGLDGPSPAAAAGPVATRRLAGVDVARGLAIVAMVVIHLNRRDAPTVGPGDGADAGLLDVLLGSPVVAGLTSPSVLFVLVAGVGVGLARRGATTPVPERRLLARGVVLVPAGLLLQAQQPDELGLAVILVQLGVLFVAAGCTPQMPTRALWWLAGGASLVGPVVLEAVQVAAPDLETVQPALGDGVGRLLLGTVVTSSYPVLALLGPMWSGMALAQLDLASPATARRLLFVGGVAGLAVAGLVTMVDATTSAASPTWLSRLSDATIRGSAVAFVANALAWSVALVGASLLAARTAARAVGPLALLGRFALTLYVLHLAIIAVAPSTLRTTSHVGAVGRAVLVCAVAAALASLWSRAVAPIGPAEALLRSATQQLAGRDAS